MRGDTVRVSIYFCERRRDGMEPSDHTACHTASASGQCSVGIDEVFTPLPDATVRGSHLSDEPAPSALFSSCRSQYDIWSA